MLILAITLIKVKHKKQRGFPDASSLDNNNGQLTAFDVTFENKMNLIPIQKDTISTEIDEA